MLVFFSFFIELFILIAFSGISFFLSIQDINKDILIESKIRKQHLDKFDTGFFDTSAREMILRRV